MLKVILIGTGNISKFLYGVLSDQPEVSIEQVLGRNERALDFFRGGTAVSADLHEIREADVYILAISDEAIEEVAHQLNIKDGLLVHTAGSIGRNVLPRHVRRGVVYPLQTISGIMPGNLKDIPICIEASREEDYLILEKLARLISERVEHINSDQRRHLHLAAVFANNFSNHLFYLSCRICEEHEVGFDLIRPLIRETCTKVMSQSPYEAQTGPARRGDRRTQDEHLDMLASAHLKKIYEMVSKSIQNTYGKEL